MHWDFDKEEPVLAATVPTLQPNTFGNRSGTNKRKQVDLSDVATAVLSRAIPIRPASGRHSWSAEATAA